MAWNKVTKEELKEAGLDVDAFSAALEKTKQIDALTTNFASLKESVDGLGTIKDQLTSLENKLKELKPAAAGGGNNGGGNNNGGGDGSNNQTEELDWVLEPEKATQSVINKMVTPLITATADMRAQMHYTNFAATNPKGFKKFEKEVKELWDKQPLAVRQNPEVIANCYKVVIAGHIDEIQKGGESFFVEAGGSSSAAGGGVGGEKKKAVDVLNKDQLDLCTKWGVDPEDYLKELQAGGVTQYA
jgi:hypothetical protein